MDNGQNVVRGRHLEDVANGAKRYILAEILDVTNAVVTELEALTVTFTGATSIAGGTSGLVPSPSTGDESKFLRGDGTWSIFGTDSFVPRTSPTAFTIATSAWLENTSETSEFVYYADITVNGLTANDYAEVNFNRVSQSIAATANVCAAGETMSGKIRIYAKNTPSDSISGEYIITKGAT